jgi:hypothetical protein
MESEQKYGSLTEQEYNRLVDTLKDIGIGKETLDLMIADELRDVRKKQTSHRVSQSQKPYYLKIFVTCNLCKSSFTRNFHMEPNGFGLHSTEIEFIPQDEEVQTSTQHTEHCLLCKPVLASKTPDTLSDMLIDRASNPRYMKLR